MAPELSHSVSVLAAPSGLAEGAEASPNAYAPDEAEAQGANESPPRLASTGAPDEAEVTVCGRPGRFGADISSGSSTTFLGIPRFFGAGGSSSSISSPSSMSSVKTTKGQATQGPAESVDGVEAAMFRLSQCEQDKSMRAVSQLGPHALQSPSESPPRLASTGAPDEAEAQGANESPPRLASTGAPDEAEVNVGGQPSRFGAGISSGSSTTSSSSIPSPSSMSSVKLKLRRGFNQPRLASTGAPDEAEALGSRELTPRPVASTLGSGGLRQSLFHLGLFVIRFSVLLHKILLRITIRIAKTQLTHTWAKKLHLEDFYFSSNQNTT